MNRKKTLILTLLLIIQKVSATPATQTLFNPWNLAEMASALGVLLMVIMGLRWMTAESTQERQEAKKGILYIVVGLLIVWSFDIIVQDLYIDNLP